MVAAVVVAIALPAGAHLALRSPESRYGAVVLKEGPCGVFGGVRSDNVTVLEPGSSIEMVWDEYIDHPGHFRIAFDVDGDDDFVDPPCLSACDTRQPEIEMYSNDAVLLDGIVDTEGGQTRIVVQLPDVECDRCTLQAIQVMYDKPPYVIPGNDIYYQCADLVLRRVSAPTPTPIGSCAGDCDDDGTVAVSELVSLVRIALELASVSGCQAGDLDGSGTIEIGEIVAAVNWSLAGC
jgi:hypothetical protein